MRDSGQSSQEVAIVDKHRHLLWVFIVAAALLLAGPWVLPREQWAVLVAGGRISWSMAAVLVALAAMVVAYVCWIVVFIRRTRSRARHAALARRSSVAGRGHAAAPVPRGEVDAGEGRAALVPREEGGR